MQGKLYKYDIVLQQTIVQVSRVATWAQYMKEIFSLFQPTLRLYKLKYFNWKQEWMEFPNKGTIWHAYTRSITCVGISFSAYPSLCYTQSLAAPQTNASAQVPTDLRDQYFATRPRTRLFEKLTNGRVRERDFFIFKIGTRPGQ